MEISASINDLRDRLKKLLAQTRTSNYRAVLDMNISINTLKTFISGKKHTSIKILKKIEKYIAVLENK
jgi:hypothetical protein